MNRILGLDGKTQCGNKNINQKKANPIVSAVDNSLFKKITSITDNLENIKIGLEATGHYSYNILGFLIEKGLTTYVLNPLHTNLYRKGLSLRKTKTDKVDAYHIALMIMSKQFLKSYSNISYHNENLKSLQTDI